MAYLPTGKELIDPYKLLEASGIRADMQVADFGCGTLGHYVFPAAKLVGPNGKVFAVDILKSVLAGVESRQKMESASNIVTVWGDLERVHGVNIADASLDLGLLINNLFMSKQQPAMVKECVRCLKPGGLFVIVDWRPVATAIGPDVSVRVSPAVARQLAEGAGLVYERDLDPGQLHYGMLFKKP
jgi:ubiquinone/menaquinone biosynthesis C-methylase UbiE